VSIRDKVFEIMLFFLEHADEEVQLKALTGLGNLSFENYNFLCILFIRNMEQLMAVRFYLNKFETVR
jgi:ubiquitin C-terminal hydrolase